MNARPTLGRRAAAEAIGTFALVFAGCGAIVTNAAPRGGRGTCRPAKALVEDLDAR